MITAPCRDCTDRHMNCHSECNKYKEWKQELDVVKEQVLVKRIAEAEAAKRRNEAIARMRKSRVKRIRSC